jgi:hypothetical protein
MVRPQARKEVALEGADEKCIFNFERHLIGPVVIVDRWQKRPSNLVRIDWPSLVCAGCSLIV